MAGIKPSRTTRPATSLTVETVPAEAMASFPIALCVALSVVCVLATPLTVTDNQGRQFEQREIVVPTGISQDQLNLEIQKAIRDLYPGYRSQPDVLVKELSSFDDLNQKAAASEKKPAPVPARKVA
ncbi:hypothetical protein CpipJ_CPIJ011496 [Culex quinquefasciatus]|uniref:Uncharacterized protein n=1 Tax=Culex quinquefasciatus TaxID=7176 RepID=B0WVT7_CULQU|nr:hypothetical protein CpipJ_CPIJ011496 [Culex quinquefasciatus]|eukprot:XP_001861509.1 hypothetical protein CpipJ_CPIJ011496 [Culex quinquefasciatus]